MKYLPKQLKHAVFLILLMPAVAMAQESGSYQDAYAAPEGTTAKFPGGILNLTAGDLNSDGEFSFDVVYDDNVAGITQVGSSLHFDNKVTIF